MTTDGYKPTQQVREIYECDRCGNTEGVREYYNLRDGKARLVWIDCPAAHCGGRPPREEVIMDPESRKVIRVQPDTQTTEQQVRDCLREDARKGEPGGGSKSGKSRKKPLKPREKRPEQEAPVFSNGGSPGGITVKRVVSQYAEADQRVVLYVPRFVKKFWVKESQYMSTLSASKWTQSRVIRSAMRAFGKKVEAVESFHRKLDGEILPEEEERVYVEVRLYPDEKLFLDKMCEVWGCSQGEFVAECVKCFSEAQVK